MRDLPDPGFAGDDGTASADLAAALAAYEGDPVAGHAAAMAVLQRQRLVVPVVAILGEVEDDGRDKASDMATVLTRGRDGRTALLAFSGTDALRRWDPSARPVPVAAATAAEAALQQGAAAMVVDVAGPVLFVVEADDLHELAQGSILVRVSDRYAWVRPDR